MIELNEKLIKSSNLYDVEIVILYLIDADTIKIVPFGEQNYRKVYSSAIYGSSLQDNSLCNNSLRDNQFFVVENNAVIVKVLLSDIYYFEKIKTTHNTCIIYKGGYAIFRSELKDIAKKLDSSFMQCHKAYIANLNQVQRIEKMTTAYTLHFENGQSCPCSLFYSKGVLEWIRQLSP